MKYQKRNSYATTVSIKVVAREIIRDINVIITKCLLFWRMRLNSTYVDADTKPNTRHTTPGIKRNADLWIYLLFIEIFNELRIFI